MKRILLFMALLMQIAVLPRSHAADATYKHPYDDGGKGVPVETVKVNPTLLYYDYGGPDGKTKGYTTGYVLFQAQNDGEELTISFTRPVEFTNAEAALYIYEGDCKYGTDNTWKGAVPEGYVKAVKNGDTFTFSAASGAISVLYYNPGSESGAGWEATLSAAPGKDMEWKSLSANQTGLPGYCYPGAKGVVVCEAVLTTDGGGNPFALTSMGFKLDGTTDISELENLRLTRNGEVFGDTIAAASSALTFTGNMALRSGNNVFQLMADVKTSATPGNVIDAVWTSAIVAGTERVTSPVAPEGNRTIANMLFMQSGENTYTVTSPINFYDDGGPEGAYTREFTGTATFLPGEEGKKVAVDFTELDLFNTSSSISVGNNDVIKVYAGRMVTESSLLATIIQNEPVRIHSTAADGALTVTFASRTGYPKQGFGSVVSLFTPVAMEVDSVSAQAAETGTVSAGQTHQPFIDINLHAEGTEPAAAISGFTFALGGTPALVKSAQLYYLGDDKTAAGRQAGQGVPNGSTLKITTDGLTLSERDNYFRLYLDIAPEAENDQSVSASFTGYTINGTARTIATPVEASRTIFNEVLFAPGTRTVTVNSPWAIRNTPSVYSYYGYDNLEGDQIVTFLPGKEGYVTQLELSKLNLYFSSYQSEQYQSRFKIIYGTDPNGTVVYKATKDDQAAQVGQVFRSSSPDGAITIVFNTNGNKGSNSSAGFAGTVSIYKSQPMQVQSVSGMQASTAILPPGATSEPIIGLKVNTIGNLDVKKLESVAIDLKGSLEQVDSVRLYTTGKEPVFDASTAVEIARSGAAQTLTLTCAEAAYLLESDTYYWVAFDMKQTITPEKEIDARFTAVTISGQAMEVTNADPEGVRITKNVYLFKGDDVVTVDAPLLFYDDGGPSDKYTKDHKGAVTFRPAQAGKSVRFTFHSFDSPDYFEVYSGTSTSSTDRLLRVSNSTWSDDQAPVMSLAADGALTVKFSPASYNTPKQGWEILVEAVTPQPLSVDTVTVTPVAHSTLRGATDDNPMLKVAVKVGGEKGSLTFKNMTFSCEGTTADALRQANLWYTGATDAFAPVGQVGSSAPQSENNTLTFAGNDTVMLPGTYYFWLTYDVTATAKADDVLKAAFGSVTTDAGTVTATAGTPSASSTVTISGMSGTYRIGASGQAPYKNFTQATTALKNEGVSGPVVFEVEDGIYDEKVVFERVPGASSVNTITFRSLSGNRDNVTITYGDKPMAATTDSAYYGVVTFDRASYYTLEGMTVATTCTDAWEGLVLLKRASRHVTLRNLHVSAGRTTSYSTGRFDLIKTMGLYAHAQNCDYVTIEGCLLEGGYIGLNIGGVTSTAYPIMMTGAVVRDNIFRSQSSKQIYISGIDGGIEITGNRFEHDGQTMATSWHSIDCYRAYGDVLFADNVFDINVGEMGTGRASSANVIYIRDVASGLPASHKRICNNDIRINGISGDVQNTLCVLDVTDNAVAAQQYVDIDYNTMIMSGVQSTSSSVFSLGATFAGSKVRDNIMLADGPGEVVSCIKNNCIEGAVFTGNAFHTAGQSWGTIGAYGDGQQTYTTFEALNERLAQTNSKAEKPVFVSATVHALAEPGTLRSAVPLPEVTTDITGRGRHATTPTIGAYEYVEQTTDKPEFKEGYPKIVSATRTEAVLAIAANIPAKGYYTVQPASQQAPAKEQVLASGTAVEMNADTEATATLTGLTASTDYTAYVVLASMPDSVTSGMDTVNFRTADPVVVIPDVEVAILTTADEGNEGDTFALEGSFTGGQEPVTCTWTDAAGNELSKTTKASAVLSHSTAYFFTATDARGKSAQARIDVTVRGSRKVATFDDWYIPANSHWEGTEDNDPLLSGSYSFPNFNGKSMGYDFWTFFTNASHTSTKYESLADQYNCAAGGGLNGSANYGVAFIGSGMGMGPTYIHVTNAEAGDSIPGMWLTNAAWTRHAILNGDGSSQVEGPFAKDDYYVVTFTGYNGNNPTNTVTFALADYRFGNAADRYVLDTWQWCDLSSLGKVTKVLVEVSGTKKNQFGLTTPAYLCLDNVGDTCPWKDAARQVINVTHDADPKSLSLVSLFDFDPAVATVTYSIEAPGGLASLNAAQPGLVDVFAHTPAHGGEEFTLLAKATQQGRSQYLRIPVFVDYTNSVGMTVSGNVRLYPIPAHEVLNVATELTDYNVAIYDMSGRQMLSRTGLTGFAAIELSLTPGNYIVRLTHATGVHTRRIIVK